MGRKLIQTDEIPTPNYSTDPDLPRFDYSTIKRETLSAAMLERSKLNPFAFACVLHELTTHYGIFPPHPQTLQRLVEADAEFVDVLTRLYADEGREKKQWLGLDTAERELLNDVIARTFTGSSWPCYGDGQQRFEEFVALLNRNLTKAGWRVTLEA